MRIVAEAFVHEPAERKRNSKTAVTTFKQRVPVRGGLTGLQVHIDRLSIATRVRN